jgi:hypothetical protein
MYPSNKRSKNRMAGPILLRGAKPSNIVAITRCFVPTTGLSRPPRSELYAEACSAAEVGVEASKTDR